MESPFAPLVKRKFNHPSIRECRAIILAYSPDSQYVASGTDDETVRIWSIETGEELQRLKGQHGAVRSLVYSNDALLICMQSSRQCSANQRNFAGSSDLSRHKTLPAMHAHFREQGLSGNGFRLGSLLVAARRPRTLPSRGAGSLHPSVSASESKCFGHHCCRDPSSRRS